MKFEKNKRMFLKKILLVGLMPFYSISYLYKKKISFKKLIYKKRFSKIWLLDINDH